MTIYFITGGFGFLGQYIVRSIHRYDPQAEIRVLVRTQRKTFLDLHEMDHVITWVQGELTKPESFAGYLVGVDIVIHNAAMVLFSPTRRNEIYNSNVIGTRNLAQAALQAGCTNFIFISSISALEFRPPKITDETCIPDLENKNKYDIYGYTKRLSELELIGMKDNIRVIILNPSVILGPGSERVEAAINTARKFPVIPMMDYINAFVDVRDVADAVVLSLTRGRSGERYIVSTNNVSMVEFTRIIVKHLGKKSHVTPLSPVGIKIFDGFIALLDTLHLNPGIRRPSHMNVDKPCSNQKIMAEMGWVAKYSLDRSIIDSINRVDDE